MPSADPDRSGLSAGAVDRSAAVGSAGDTPSSGPSAAGEAAAGRSTGGSTSAGPAAAGATPAGASVAPAAADSPTAQYLVLAARSTAGAEATERATITTLAVVIPILLLVMAATTWSVVGRALRPVERMRREVAGITASQLQTRLPDPGGADEISRLASTLNDMLDRLDSSATAQRRFVSDASHELRSPSP
ncbi:hypothetical protein GCM10025867_02720 [Frondihabitans sucicola]|uniref:histidine kinase n=1 Tax=Frondihabitans sucicola TaxID=1268041 RepID=A0ABM8GI32_9MICO|nr:HAMP domain-containing protein [Frondihabitans sucicola]BDZ48031.1 hypothetical protein GCM10025867_02720 [Frondihabitans sucicola]